MPPHPIDHYDPTSLFKDGWHFMVFAARNSAESEEDILSRALESVETLENIGHDTVLVKYTDAIYLVGVAPDADIGVLG